MSAMQRIYLTAVAGVILGIFFQPDLLKGESAHSLVDSGNTAYEQGDYVKSLENYEKASQIEPDSTAVILNKGNALYKLGKYAEAFNAYEQAAGKAIKDDNRQLEAQSRYNMGNSAYSRAEILSREDPGKAYEEFNRSSQNFQSALKLDPKLSEAAHNLEIARLAAKKVEQMMQQQQKQAKQQQEAQEQAKKELEELIRQQSEAAEQSSDAAKELQHSQEQEKSVEQLLEQLVDKQKEINNRTENLNKNLQQQGNMAGQQQSAGATREHVEGAVKKQKKAREELDQNRPEQASVSQKEAAEELQKALQQMEMAGKGEQQKEADAQKKESGSMGNELTENLLGANKNDEEQSRAAAPQEEQARKGESPEDIIKEELENRKYRGSQRASGYVPVEKDW